VEGSHRNLKGRRREAAFEKLQLDSGTKREKGTTDLYAGQKRQGREEGDSRVSHRESRGWARLSGRPGPNSNDPEEGKGDKINSNRPRLKRGGDIELNKRESRRWGSGKMAI